MEESIWDDAVAGVTGNPVSELVIKDQVKETLTNGKEVILTMHGEPTYRLQVVNNEIIKVPFNQ